MLVLRVNLKSRRIFMSELSIGEVARRTGVKPSALRYYEQEGLLPRVSRAGGRRRYGERDVRMIEVLRFAQQAGFTLDEIRKLFHRFDAKAPLGARWRLLAQSKLRELDELQARIVHMRRAIEQGLACGCMRIEDCTLARAVGNERAPARARRRAGRGFT
jgi:MerR family transcriptional regulator, redox-sensitive transcriptional activator SoxR